MMNGMGKIISVCGCIAVIMGCASQSVYEANGTATTTSNFPLIEWPLEQSSPVKRLTIDQGIPTSSPMVVVSFTNIDDLTEVSSLGRYLKEFFVNDLVTYGYPVYDLEAQDEIVLIKSLGSIYRTREGQLTDNIPIEIVNKSELLGRGVQYVLAGTYTVLRNRVIVQARLIDLMNSKIASSVALSLANQNMIAELANRAVKKVPPPRVGFEGMMLEVRSQ